MAEEDEPGWLFPVSPNARTKRYHMKQAGDMLKTNTGKYFFSQHIAEVWDSLPERWGCQKRARVPKAIITPISRRKNTLRRPKTPFRLGNSNSCRSLKARKVFLFFIVTCLPCFKTLSRLLATTGNRMVGPRVLSYHAPGGLVFYCYIA